VLATDPVIVLVTARMIMGASRGMVVMMMVIVIVVVMMVIVMMVVVVLVRAVPTTDIGESLCLDTALSKHLL